jgi:hypothetical protein
MKKTYLGLHLAICSLVVACSGSNSETGGNTESGSGSGGLSASGGMTASTGSSTGGAIAATGGDSATGGTSSPSGTKNTGGNTNTGGTNAPVSGGSSSMPVGGSSTKATGGTTNTVGGTAAKATGGAPATSTGGAAAGGTQSGGSSAKATGGATNTGGKATGGGNATGGRPSTGGTTSAAGGSTAPGGGASSCGPGTLNPNPFGCSFAWGLSDPAGSFSALSFLQFSTFWVEYGVAADGTFSSCSGCTWLRDKVASTSLVPVYYAYIIGYYAHANGIVDGNQCPASNPNCPNLTNNGASFVKAHRSTIIQAYANYAKQSYAVWSTKPLVWLLEGDFVQFANSSQSSPLTMTEVAQLAADITCAIKGNMPNAVVGINHSTWNTNDVTNNYWNAMKSVSVKYDFAWTTGVANSNGFFNTGVTASTYNGATATYSYLHQVSGTKILVDDGCGANTAEDWAPASAATLNARIASGVMAFTHCASLEANYQSLTAALKPQLNSTCN